MILPYIEFNPASDEHVGSASGLFIGPLCVLGVKASRLGVTGETPGWIAGLIVLNIAFGVWKEPRPLPRKRR